MKTLHLRIDDEAEKLIDELRAHWGVVDDAIIRKALWLLSEAHKAGGALLISGDQVDALAKASTLIGTYNFVEI